MTSLLQHWNILQMLLLIILNPSLTNLAQLFTSGYSVNIRILQLQLKSWAIKWLKPSKCVGVEWISYFIIKGCSHIFIPLLIYIFNLCITSKTFPSLWKQTAVIPIFKKSSSTMACNYRPTSVLHNFSIFLISYPQFYVTFYAQA